MEGKTSPCLRQVVLLALCMQIVYANHKVRFIPVEGPLALYRWPSMGFQGTQISLLGRVSATISTSIYKPRSMSLHSSPILAPSWLRLALLDQKIWHHTTWQQYLHSSPYLIFLVSLINSWGLILLCWLIWVNLGQLPRSI
jgi:hypothetical protein